MKKAAEYLEHAHQCRILAASATNPKHREMLSHTATIWESLARNREQRLARQQTTDNRETAAGDDGDLKSSAESESDGAEAQPEPAQSVAHADAHAQ